MQFVSAQWVEDQIMGTRAIRAVGDDGNVYWIGDEASDVPPWPEYLANGGTIDAAEEIITGPGGPQLPSVERDYGAEIDALDARVTMLEARVLALESK